jgi:hypothetical protein
MKALPFPLHCKSRHFQTSCFRNQAALNMQLFRYWKVVQLGQNAITHRKITNESHIDASAMGFFDANIPTNT